MKTFCSAATILWLAAATFGCSAKPETPPAKPLSEAALSKLEAADKADGKEDKIVSRCPACMLMMDGDPKHTSHLEGYTVHSCHEVCAEVLEKNPEDMLARLP